ncbi:YadA-like family protein [Halomonas sp. CH40]
MAFGVAAESTGRNAIAIGSGNGVLNNAGDLIAYEKTQAEGVDSVAIGRLTKASGLNAIAIGREASAAANNTSAFGRDAKASGASSTAVGRNSKATELGASAFGLNAEATGEASTALGRFARSSGEESAAVGRSAAASGVSSTAVGRQASASASSASAVGNGAKATANFASAFGVNAEASGTSSLALSFSNATAERAIAIGPNAVASSDRTVAVGSTAKALGSQSVAIGRDSTAQDEKTIALGAFATANKGGAIALGSSTLVDGKHSIAMGRQSEVSGERSMALGQDAKVGTYDTNGDATSSANKAIALGDSASASANNATAVGLRAEASALNASAFGVDATASGSGSIALGFSNATKENAISVGASANATAERAIAIGNSSKASVDDAIAMGAGAQATGLDAIAMGSGAKASGEQSISIGYGNEVSGAHSGAVGDPNNISGTGSYAQGNDNTIEADNAGAFGNNNTLTATAAGSRIIGNDNNLDVADAFVMGNGADVTVAGGVALGSGSVASTDAGTTTGVYGYDVSTDAAAAPTSEIGATQSTKGAVSVGGGTGNDRRQITNLAAGAQDTDAVNVAQLKAVRDIAGSGWDVNTSDDATVTASTVAAGKEVDFVSSDSNVAITHTQDTNGDTDVDFSLSDDLTIASSISVTGGPTINSTGINMGDDKITNLATGTADSDAANVGQLTVVDAGTNASVTAATDATTGQTTYTVDADGTTVSAGSTDVTVVAGTKDATTNLTDYAVDLSLDAKNSLENANKGWELQANSELTTDNIGPGETAIFAEGKNIDVSRDANKITVATKDEVEFTQITVGDATDPANSTVITNAGDGLDVGGDQITNVGSGLTNVAGDVVNNIDDANPDNAANIGDLQNVNNDLIDTGFNITADNSGLADPSITEDNVKLGETVDYTSADGNIVTTFGNNDNEIDFGLANVVTVGDTTDATKNPVTIDGDAGTVGGLTNTTLTDPAFATAGRAATEEQLSVLATDGLDFTGNDNSAGDVHRDLGETLAIEGGATSGGTYTGANLRTVTDPANGAINLQMTDSPDFTNVNVSGDLDVDGTTTLGDNFSVVGDQVTYNIAPDQITNGTQVVNKDYVDSKETHYYSVNDVGTQQGNFNNEGAVGDYALAAGTNALAESGFSVAVGDGATTKVFGSGQVAIGNDATTFGQGDIAIGMNAQANGAGNVVIGDGAKASTAGERDGVALGHDAEVTYSEGVALGSDSVADGSTLSTAAYVPTGATSVAADDPESEVSVGAPTQPLDSADSERRITNVAAGATDTDAVNVSQLKALDSVVDQGFNITADTADLADPAATEDTVKLGDTVAYTSTDGNITTTVRDNEIDFGLASVVTVGDATDATQTPVTIDGDAGTVGGLTNTTFDPGNFTSGQAATEDQLKDVSDVANAGWNVQTTDADATVSNVAPSKKVDFVSSDNNVAITHTQDANGDTDVDFSLSDNLTIANSISVTGGPTINGTGINMGDDKITNLAPGTADTDAANVGQLTAVDAGTNASVTAAIDATTGQTTYTVDADGTTVSAGSTDVTVVAGTKDATTNLTDYAVDLSQDAKDSLENANKGWELQANSELTTDNIGPGETAIFAEGKNIDVSRDVNKITVATKDEVEFTQITVGDATDPANSTVITNAGDGLDVGGDQITNVGSGLTNVAGDVVNNIDDANPDNAANIGDLQNVNNDLINTGFNITADNSGLADPSITEDNVKLGETVDYTSADGNIVTTFGNNDNEIDFGLANVVTVGDTTDATKNPVTIDGDAGTVGGLTNTTFDPGNFTSGQAATEDQLKDVSDVANAGWNVQTTDADATVSNVAPSKKVDFVSSDNNVAITHTQDANGDTDVDFSLSDNLTIANSISVTGGPTINGTGINMGDDKITNLAPGTADTDAANVGQLTAVDAGTNASVTAAIDATTGQTTYTVDADGTTVSAGSTDVTVVAGTKDATTNLTDYAVDLSQDAKDSLENANKGWELQANSELTTDNIGPGETAIFAEGKNIDVSRDANKITVATKDEVEFTQITVGDATDPANSTVITNAGDGLDVGGDQITNVGSGLTGTTLETAEGDDLTNAVNVGDLQSANTDLIDKGFNITADNTNLATADDNVKLGGTVDFTSADGNIITTVDDNEIDFGLGNELTVGEDGEPGSITIVGQDGIDGKDGIALNGKDGTIGLTGPAGPNGTDGLTTISIQNGTPGVNGVDGETRIIYTDPEGNDQEVATLDDGLKFVGDDGEVVERKLNDTLGLTGGADTEALTDKNIGITKKDDGTLNVQLAENVNLGDKGSVQMGNTTVNNDGLTIVDGPTISKDGIDMGGLDTNGEPTNKITNLAPGTDGTDAVNVDQLTDVEDIASAGWDVLTSDTTNDAFSNVAPNGKVDFVSEDGSIVVEHTRDDQTGNTSIDFGLGNELTVGEDGEPGSITIVGQDGIDGKDGIALNGKDGTIGLTGPAGPNGTDGLTTISIQNGTPGVNGVDGETRIIYTDPEGNDQEVATLDDGLKFVGDDGEVVERKLNDTLGLTGGADTEALTDKNIGITKKDDGTLNVQLAENVNLGDKGSVQMGNTTVNNDGLTIVDGPTISKDGIDMGGLDTNGEPTNKITNLAPGTDGTDAVNVDQLTDVEDIASAGWDVLTSDTTNDAFSNVAPNGKVDFVSEDGSIVVEHTRDDQTGNTSIDFGLGNELTVGEDGEPGSITIVGQDGIDGKDGIALNGKDGTIGLTGPAGPNGTDGLTTISIQNGTPGVNGVDGETRIIYTDPEGNDQEVATLDDGLKFVGDDGEVVERKLNDTLGLTGGADTEALTDKNIGITKKDDGTLNVQLAENVNLGDKGSVQMGNTTVNNDGLTIVDGPTISKDGIDMGGLDTNGEPTNKITNLAPGTDGTDAVNVDQLTDVEDIASAGWDVLTSDTTNDAFSNVAPNGKVDFVSEDGSIVVEHTRDDQTGNTSIDFGLGNELTVGEDGEPGSITIVGQDGIDGKDGIALNGADGTIGLAGPAGPNGTDGLTTISIQNGTPGVNGVDGETRIIYTDPEGNDQEVATLDDGLKFVGDDGEVVERKLNDTLGLTGGADTEALTDKNIGITKKDDGTLNVQLAENVNLGDKGSVQMGNTTVNNDGLTIVDGPTISKDGIDMGGLDTNGEPTNKITNLAPGTDGTDAVNVDQLTDVEDIASAGWDVLTSDTTNDAFSNVAPNGKVDFVSEDGSIVVEHTRNDETGNTSIDFGLGNELTVGEDGEPGSITIVGENGIALNGKDGTIGLTGPAGPNGTDGLTTISIQDRTPGVNGVDGETRIIYTDPEGNDQEVATLDDGLKFVGDDGEVVERKLNETLGLSGGADTEALTDKNIGITKKDDGTLNVQLAENVNLGDKGSVQMGNTTVNNDGLTIVDGPTISKDGIDMGGLDTNGEPTNKITNLAPGTDGTDAVNVDQLTDVEDIASAGWDVLTSDTTNDAFSNVAPNGKVDFVSEDGSIVVEHTRDDQTGNTSIDFGLGNELTVGEDGEPGSITIVGENGIDGKDGIALNGKDGTIGLTGPAGPNGTDGLTTISIQDRTPGVNGVDGETRIIYTDPEGNDQEVATLDDGLKFVGDDGEVVERKLNETLGLSGGADTEALTDKNIGITKKDDGTLNVQLAENVNLGDEGSVVMGDTTVNNDGLTIVDGPSVTQGGINAGDDQITGVGSGLGDKSLSELSGDALNNAVNVGDLKSVNETATAGWDLQANAFATDNVAPGEKVQLIDGQNIEITREDDQVLKIATASDLTSDSLTINDNGPTINGGGIDLGGLDDAGSPTNKITNLAPGDVAEDSTDAINGSQLYQVINSGDFDTRYVNTNDDGLTESDSFANATGATAVGYEATAEADRSLALGYEAMATLQGSVALGEGAVTTEVGGYDNADFVYTLGADESSKDYSFAGLAPVSTVSVGSAGNERTITNVGAGRITSDSTDAINGSQLYAAMDFMNDLDGRLTIVEGDESDETAGGTLPGGGTNGVVKYDRDGDQIDYSNVTLEGEDGTTVTNVADGDIADDSSDAINGSQLYDTNQNVAGNSSNIADNSQRITNNEGDIADNSQRITTNENSIGDINETIDKGLNFGADEGEVVNRQLGDTVAITGDDNITTKTTDDGVQVTLERDLDVDSVTTGGTTINDNGLTIEDGPSVTRDGIDAGGQVITNVAPGVEAGDAVNVGQMNELGQRFQNEINNVNGRIDGVEKNANAGSASAIAASSVPQAWRSGESMVSVGAGTYGGESAVAVGVSRLSDNGRWIIQGKVTGDSQGNFGAGVGAGWHW